MKLIQSAQRFTAQRGGDKHALVFCGFGGSIWQVLRLIAVLRYDGYNVTAVDFPKQVLATGDPTLLPQLMDEAVEFAEAEAKRVGEPMLLVGISLGALVSLNVLRRSPLFSEGVLITGGDIVKVAHALYGRKVWPQAYDELATHWQDVNMYTPPERLAGKRLLFVLPTGDRLIDTSDVHREVAAQTAAGNHLILVERGAFGHIGTIIEETILFPKRVREYIQQVSHGSE